MPGSLCQLNVSKLKRWHCDLLNCKSACLRRDVRISGDGDTWASLPVCLSACLTPRPVLAAQKEQQPPLVSHLNKRHWRWHSTEEDPSINVILHLFWISSISDCHCPCLGAFFWDVAHIILLSLFCVPFTVIPLCEPDWDCTLFFHLSYFVAHSLSPNTFFWPPSNKLATSILQSQPPNQRILKYSNFSQWPFP